MMPRSKMLLAVALGVVLLTVGWWLRAGRSAELLTVAMVEGYDATQTNEDALADATLAAAEIPQQLKVERGQTLFGVFESLGLPREQANSATFAVQQHMDPRQLRARN